MMNNYQPIYNPIKIKLALMCNGDRDLPVKISFYSQMENGDDKLYGEGITTVNKIINGEKSVELMKGPARGGNVMFDLFSVVEMPNFMEYLRSGWAVNTSFAVDFTASNGDIIERNSLHW